MLRKMFLTSSMLGLAACSVETTNTALHSNGRFINPEDMPHLVQIHRGRLDYNPKTERYDKLVDLEFNCTAWIAGHNKVVSAAHCFLGPAPSDYVVYCDDGSTIPLEGPFGPIPIQKEKLKGKNCILPPVGQSRVEIFRVVQGDNILPIDFIEIPEAFLDRNSSLRQEKMDLAVLTVAANSFSSSASIAATRPEPKDVLRTPGYGLMVDPGFYDADHDGYDNDVDLCPVTPFDLRYQKNSNGGIAIGPNGKPIAIVDAHGCGLSEIARLSPPQSGLAPGQTTEKHKLRIATNTFHGFADDYLAIRGPVTRFPALDQQLAAPGDSGAPLLNAAGQVVGLLHGGRLVLDDAGSPMVDAKGIPLLESLYTDLGDADVRKFLDEKLKP